MFAERNFRFAMRSMGCSIISGSFGGVLAAAAAAAAAGVLALTTVSTVTYAVEPANPAHALAEKFSRGSDGARRPAQKSEAAEPPASPATQAATSNEANARAQAERRAAEEQRAYEEDMLARARAEAEARLKADMSREQEAARQRAETEQQERKAQADALERAAAEQTARKNEQASRNEEEARQRAQAEQLALEREAESRKLAERLRAARRAREEARARAAAEAEAEARLQADARLESTRTTLRRHTERLARKLEEIKSQRAQYARSAPATQVTGATHRSAEEHGFGHIAKSGQASEPQPQYVPVPATVTSTSSLGTTDADPRRATVLLVMKPGNRGIRRWNKTADPMLCIEDNCYISSGVDSSAKRISRSKGFGPAIALGTRAGACNGQLACVFRDVDLINDHAWMQPIDLRIVRHDRREARRISSDPTCTTAQGRISCTRTVESDDYRAWIIPENVARHAGPAALKAALDNSLQGNQLARSPLH